MKWAAHLAVTVLGAGMISTSVIHTTEGFMPPGEQLLLLSSCILLSAAVVLIPYAIEHPASLSHQLFQAASAGISTLLIICWQTPLSLISPILWKLTLGLCLLTFTLTAIAGLLTALSRSHNSAIYWTTLLLLIITSAPLWLGPAVESFYLGQTAINAIIATSPLSYLATLADWDYLRGEWFYRHTPFGGLRFDYPSIPITSLVYLTIGLTCHCISRIIRPHQITDNSCIKLQPSLPT